MRWLYGAAGLLVLMVGIAWFHPDSAPLVRWQVQRLMRFSQRKHLAISQQPMYILLPITEFYNQQREERRRFLLACEQLASQYPDDAQILAFRWIASHNADYPIDWWLSMDYVPLDEVKLTELHTLQSERFPRETGLLALLIHGELRRLSLQRTPVEQMFAQLQTYGSSWVDEPRREAAARVLARAYAGERLDPQNSFFTLMRAAALLELGRDREATQALFEAARKPLWNDYRSWLVEAHYKVLTLSHLARQSPMPEMGYAELYQSVSNYDWLPLRYWRIARLFVGLAAGHEKRGAWREGLAIRLALAHLIAQMRYQNRSIRFIEGSCGLFRLTGLFPAEQIPPPANQLDPATQRLAAQILRECPTTEPLTAVRWGFFLSELEKRGFQREAAWFLKELRANQQTLAIVQRFNEQLFGVPLNWWRFYQWWNSFSHRWAIIGALCLWLACLMALGGLLAGILQRWRVPEAVLLSLVFALGTLGVLSFILSDAGTRLVGETLASLRPDFATVHSWSSSGTVTIRYQIFLGSHTGTSRMQQVINWLTNNPHVLQIAIGVILFLLLTAVVLFFVLLQHRRTSGTVPQLRAALWAGCALFLLTYLLALGNYFRTQSRFIEIQRGCLLGGRAYIQSITGKAIPTPQEPLK